MRLITKNVHLKAEVKFLTDTDNGKVNLVHCHQNDTSFYW